MSTGKLRKFEEAFSERLKMLRKERGWSQEDLAARLDVSPGSVGNWEIGPHEPHPKTLSKLAALFDVDVYFLTHGERLETPRHSVMHDKPPEYGAIDLGRLLRDIEDTQNSLGRIAEQLRKATARPSAATALAEMASASYDQKRDVKNHPKETADSDVKRIITKAESPQAK